jgi:hypothetical protein
MSGLRVASSYGRGIRESTNDSSRPSVSNRNVCSCAGCLAEVAVPILILFLSEAKKKTAGKNPSRFLGKAAVALHSGMFGFGPAEELPNEATSVLPHRPLTRRPFPSTKGRGLPACTSKLPMPLPSAAAPVALLEL